jgi:restriction system protein
MTAWRDYQRRAADIFRAHGMDANVEERVIGARGQHDVDVVVRTSRAGIEQLWVVECKWWRRSVSKLHVAALASVVQDVGADRGILLSETGFQAGAIRLASLSNITLTSLTGLKDGMCLHESTVVEATPGWLACTACGMMQPTECEASLGSP